MDGLTSPRSLGMLAAVVFATAACNAATSPKQFQPVNIRVSANSAGSPATSVTAGALEITSLRLALGAASLGTGDQFGCVDCQGHTVDQSIMPRIVSIPLNGGAVQIETEEVAAGRYTEAKIALERLPAATADWTSGTTIEIVGRYNGAQFTLPLAIEGEFRQLLQPPVDIAGSAPAAAVAVTITLPVASWFTSNGTALDPADPAQRAQIEANARRSIQPDDRRVGERESADSPSS